MASFYCHQCNRSVAINQDFECQRCGSGFVEEITRSSQNANRESDNHRESQEPGAGRAFVFRTGSSSEEPNFVPFLNMVFGGPSQGPLFQMLNQLSNNAPVPHQSSSSLPSATPHATSAQSSDATSSSEHPTSPPGPSRRPNFAGPGTGVPPGFQFLNQLIANLVDGGGTGNAHVTFTFGNGGGEGDPLFTRIHGNAGDYAWGEGGLDQIVTFLLNQFDQSAQHESLRPEEIERIPMIEVREQHVSNGTQCTTCMDVFKAGERVAKLDCDHIFHRPCIEPWLRRRNTCPICRQTIDPKKWPKCGNDNGKITDIDELD